MSEHTASFSAPVATGADPMPTSSTTVTPSARASCTQFLHRVLLGLTAQLSGATTDSRRGETVLLAVEPVLARLLQEHRRRLLLHADAAHSLVVSESVVNERVMRIRFSVITRAQGCFSSTLLQKDKFAVSLASAVSRHLLGTGTAISALDTAPRILLHRLTVAWQHTSAAPSSDTSVAPPLPPVARPSPPPSLLAALCGQDG